LAVYERIVVAVDGSELAERALAHAETLARALGAPLHLVRVADVARLHLGANEAALAYAAIGGELEREEAAAGAYLEQTRTQVAARGHTATTELRRGTAGPELVASTGPRDLLVMASHGRHGALRWLLGSVAEDVARRAKGPVLLVRAGPEPSPDGGAPTSPVG